MDGVKLFIGRLLASEFVRFGLVGVIGLLVDSVVLVLLVFRLGLNPYVARFASFLAAVTTTWFFNRLFTFRGARGESLLRQWSKFVAANSIGAVVNYGVYAGLLTVSAWVADAPYLGVAAGSIAGLAFNFSASKTLVFRTGAAKKATRAI